jgi:hypothetical protein
MELHVENPRRAGASWSSIFAGTFVFLAIETTFGLLGAAVFPGMHVGGGLGVGPGIWMIILSIIALFFGAKAAGHLSGEVRRLNGMYYGLVTFGLSIVACVVIAALVAGNTPNAGSASLAMLDANAGWLFVTMILGGIAAGIGGAQRVPIRTELAVAQPPVSMRPAA